MNVRSLGTPLLNFGPLEVLLLLLDRYFRVSDADVAADALDVSDACEVGEAMREYRKELRRQSELLRAAKTDQKWWEDR